MLLRKSGLFAHNTGIKLKGKACISSFTAGRPLVIKLKLRQWTLNETYKDLLAPHAVDARLMGVLVNDNAGLVNGIWYLLFITQGQEHRSPALVRCRLRKHCSAERGYRICPDIPPASKARTHYTMAEWLCRLVLGLLVLAIGDLNGSVWSTRPVLRLSPRPQFGH
jgi:hypothetical protein